MSFVCDNNCILVVVVAVVGVVVDDEEDVREVMGSAVYETIIPRNIKISEAPSHGKPILLYDHSCVGSEAYVNLAAEVLKKGNFGGLTN